VEDFGELTDVAAYMSSASQSTDSEIMTSHGLTFRNLETGAFYLQTQLLQVAALITHCVHAQLLMVVAGIGYREGVIITVTTTFSSGRGHVITSTGGADQPSCGMEDRLRPLQLAGW